jgi:hypothetical protein
MLLDIIAELLLHIFASQKASKHFSRGMLPIPIREKGHPTNLFLFYVGS